MRWLAIILILLFIGGCTMLVVNKSRDVKLDVTDDVKVDSANINVLRKDTDHK